MDEFDRKEIKAARPTNIARMASALIFIILYSFYDYSIVLYFAILQFSLSLIWFWLIEKKFSLYKKIPTLWYIPASIDVFFATASVYITGVSYSPVIVAYILITCMSSVDLIRARGLFTTIASSVAFIFILFLTKFEIIPFLNILGENKNGISIFSMFLSGSLLSMACFTANSVIFQIYYQLNDKNNELSNSLDKINLLKLQQDADYALTARLMEPFGGNFVKSKFFFVESLIKQKKSFTFKDQALEIGGDLILADELFFNESKFIFFLNADAMGKSMQGACGALVLGVICKSILTNTQIKTADTNIQPQSWLLNAVQEMQRIFESFDGSMLASVFIGLIEEKTGNLYYLNAEHPGAILYRDEIASFLSDNVHYRKIGTLGIQDIFQMIEYTQLVAGDTLFIGSDGKDDLILNSTPTRKINEDEFLFPRIVQKNKGSLLEICKELETHGELSDDLSIIKITYHGAEN
jgi:Stage II sporulation protein E (SpoIIE)